MICFICNLYLHNEDKLYGVEFVFSLYTVFFPLSLKPGQVTLYLNSKIRSIASQGLEGPYDLKDIFRILGCCVCLCLSFSFSIDLLVVLQLEWTSTQIFLRSRACCSNSISITSIVFVVATVTIQVWTFNAVEKILIENKINVIIYLPSLSPKMTRTCFHWKYVMTSR